MAVTQQHLSIDVSDKAGTVSALLERPANAHALYVLAHGAGAGMTHSFMTETAESLHSRGIATLRFQFPFTERGGKRPSPRPWLQDTVAAAITAGHAAMPDTPLLAGGKSMGGRMTSLLAAADPPPDLAGLIYLGFPLHPPGKEGVTRATHLPSISIPTLFVQGTRDKLAVLPLMQRVLDGLPKSRTTMHVVEGADHGFHVLKRSGRTHEEVVTEIADAVAAFVARVAR